MSCCGKQTQAQNWTELIKKVAPDAADNDEFGKSVAIAGNYALVGAPIKNSGQGVAYLFKKDKDGADTWGFVKQLIAPASVTTSAGFGGSVALAGDYALIGASETGDGNNQGAAYIFKKDQGGSENWGLVQSLSITLTDYDNFGSSVALAGDYALVGSYGNNNFQGAAYIFNKNQGGSDNWGFLQKLTALDGASDDNFGRRVAISGSYALIGAENKFQNNSNNPKGAAYVFKNTGGNWTEIKSLTASDGTYGDYFGSSLALSGDYALIGAYANNGFQGAVYAYYQPQGGADTWGEVQKLITSDASASFFGQSVAVEGDVALVGANGTNSNQGSAYYFARSTPTTWTEIQSVTASDGVSGANFGNSVAISGKYSLVGANITTNSQGAVYVFKLVCPVVPPASSILSLMADESVCPVRLVGRAIGTSFVFTGPGGYVFSNVYRQGNTYDVFGLGVIRPGVYTLNAVYANECESSALVSQTVTVNRSCP